MLPAPRMRSSCTSARLTCALALLLGALLPGSAGAVQFSGGDLQTGIGFTTVLTLGPEDPDPGSNADGCIYAVHGSNGVVHRICFDASKSVTSDTQVVDINGGGSVNNVLGVTIDPDSDPAGEIALYLGYSDDNSAPFQGKIARAVSTDGGVSYTVDEDFITGLARSSFDHQTNGVDFGPDNCLYISQGNNSNAGYDSAHAESRLSSAILRACFKDASGGVDPGFDGNCGGGNSQQDCGVEVYASGVRNPYDIAWHSNGKLYNADNDANQGFRDNCGAEANDFGCTCQTPPVEPIGDEINLIEEGMYYGSPNPYRANPSGLQCNGGTDGGDSCTTNGDCGGGGLCQDLSALCTGPLCGETAQCYYFGYNHGPAGGEDPNGVYRAPIAQIGALLDGITEYRGRFANRTGNAFCSDWNGDLLVTGGPGSVRRFDVSTDGLSVSDQGTGNLGGASGLDVVVGPDGTIYTADLNAGKVTYLEPTLQTNPLAANYFNYCASGEACTDGVCETDTDNDGLGASIDPCLGDALNRCAGTVATDATSGNPIRINANTGGDSCAGNKTDCNGDTWYADFGYNQAANAFTCSLPGGCPLNATAIFGCTDAQTEDIFRCEHWDSPDFPELQYSFNVADGDYVVNLLFMNAFAGTDQVGDRVFDILVEGATVYAGFDQVAAAGGSGVPVMRSVLTAVSDGNGLQIELAHVIENPNLKGIEVLKVGGCSVDPDCDDGNSCSDDVCNAGTCEYTNNTDPCDDGVSCTGGDVCAAGVCSGVDNCTGGQVCDPGLDMCVAPPSIQIRINVNGSQHVGTDYPGTWQADPGSGGVCGPNAYTNGNPINGTVDDPLFSGEVWGNPMTCAVDDGGQALPAGDYDVNLYFAEIFQGPGCPGGGSGTGQRVFDVALEGTTVETGIDIFSENGCAASTTDPNGGPIVRSYNVNVADGVLDISMPASVDNAKISAIEVIGGAPPECSINPDCDDSNPCTDDVCNAGTCEYTNNTDPCDDGSVCTTGDVCSAGSCQSGTPVDPDDGVACTVDSCDPVTGVANVPNHTFCDDSDVCTTDTCDAVLDCLNDPIPFCTGSVPTDIQMPGTQPEEVTDVASSDDCSLCHDNYSPGEPMAEPSHGWGGSMMAHASRDPVFWAAMAVAEQDFAGSGDLCLRCHVPKGWMAGRSVPTDGSALLDSDASGVQCDLCHRLTNPDSSEHLGVQNPPFVANDGVEGFFGSGMYVLWNQGTKLGPYNNAPAPHGFLQSQLHRSPDACGTCHDVSNPAVGDLAHNNGAQIPLAPGEYSGVPGSPVDQKAAFKVPPSKYGVVERTYSENAASALSQLPISSINTLPLELQDGAIQAAYDAAQLAGMGGDYGDGTTRTFSCQSCHMQALSGEGCSATPGVRDDLPTHDLTGGNYWVPDAIQYLDGLGQLRLGGGLNASQLAELDAGKLRAQQNLTLSASLSVTGNTLRVVNLTGHKLITGYPEGRRMWLNVKWYDAVDTLLREDGAYGTITATIDGSPTAVDTLLDLNDPNGKIYEAHNAVTQEWADQLITMGTSSSLPLSFDRETGAVAMTLGTLAAQAPGTYHETMHFVLNNYLASDDRIPPYGMAYDEAAARNALPVPDTQYGNPGPGGTYDYWDDFGLNPPAGADRADIELLYQPVSWEYIQFLDLANNGQNAFLAEEGNRILDAWLNTGMAAPVMMASTTWTNVGACGDGTVDAGEDCDDGAANGTTPCGCALDCTYPDSLTSCNDGVSCTEGDHCDGAGACVFGSYNHALCDDADVCNGSEVCDTLLDCQPGTPLNPGDGVACTDDSCDPVTGVVNVANDANCDDADVCTGTETCDAVLDCQPGTPLDPDDGVACTDDSCDPVTGVANVPNDGPCQNGVFCDGAEVCDPALDCQPGTPAADDDLFCTEDSCDEQSQTVVNTPNPAACVDDGDACTASICDPVVGCIHVPVLLGDCTPSLPSASPAGRMLLGLLVLGAGVMLLTQRRRGRA